MSKVDNNVINKENPSKITNLETVQTIRVLKDENKSSSTTKTTFSLLGKYKEIPTDHLPVMHSIEDSPVTKIAKSILTA